MAEQRLNQSQQAAAEINERGPMFRASDGTVVGLLHAGFNGTNITRSLPSWLVAKAFEHYLASAPLDFTTVPTFEEVSSVTASSELRWESI